MYRKKKERLKVKIKVVLAEQISRILKNSFSSLNIHYQLLFWSYEIIISLDKWNETCIANKNKI